MFFYRRLSTFGPGFLNVACVARRSARAREVSRACLLSLVRVLLAFSSSACYPGYFNCKYLTIWVSLLISVISAISLIGTNRDCKRCLNTPFGTGGTTSERKYYCNAILVTQHPMKRVLVIVLPAFAFSRITTHSSMFKKKYTFLAVPKVNVFSDKERYHIYLIYI